MERKRMQSGTLLRVILTLVFVLMPLAAEAGWLIDWPLTQNDYLSYTTRNNARSVACDYQGEPHVVWYESRGGEDVWNIYYRRRLGGVTWGPIKTITSDLAYSALPSVCVGPGDTVHVVWHEGLGLYKRIYYRQYDGVSWGAEVDLVPSHITAFNPSMAVGPDWHVHLVWSDAEHGEEEIYYMMSDGTTWGPLERLTTSAGHSRYPSIAADQAGNLHVVWQDDRDGAEEIYYVMNDGLGWGSAERLTYDSTGSFDPCIATEPEGDVHVVWSDLRDGNHEVYYIEKEDGVWEAEERLTSAAGDSRYPSVAAWDSGSVNVVWHDDRDGDFEIYHKEYDGALWSSDEALTDDPGESKAPSIAIDSSGDLHVVWRDDRDGDHEVFWKWRPREPLPKPNITSITPDSAATGEGISITDLSGYHFLAVAQVRLVKAGESGLPALGTEVVSPNQITCEFSLGGASPGEWDVVVINPDGQSDTLYGGFLITAGPWGADTRLTFADGKSETSKGNARCIAVDDANNPHVAWHDRRSGTDEIYYKSFNGLEWEADQCVSSSGVSARCPSLVFDSYGDLHVVWYDFRHRANGKWEIYYDIYDGISWGIDERVTAYDEDSALPSLAIDSQDDLHVVWYDARHGDPEIYYKTYDGSWGPDVRLTDASNFQYTPAIATDGSDNLHVVWHSNRYGDYQIFYKTNDGIAWQLEEQLTVTPGTSANATIAVDSSDRLHVAWKDDRNGDFDIYYMMCDSGVWTDDVRLTDDPATAEYPHLASDPAGNLHLAWVDERHGDAEIYYMMWDGQGWGPEHRLTASQGIATGPHIACDGLGRVHLIWSDGRDGESEIYYKLMDPGQYAGSDGGPNRHPVPLSLAIAPNPAGPEAALRFSLDAGAEAAVSVYDLTGRLVWRRDLGRLEAGLKGITWDGTDRSGMPVASGVYFVRLRAGSRASVGKLVLLR